MSAIIDTLEVKLSLDADVMSRIGKGIISEGTVQKVQDAIERELIMASEVYTVDRVTLRSAAVEAISAVVSDLVKVDLA